MSIFYQNLGDDCLSRDKTAKTFACESTMNILEHTRIRIKSATRFGTNIILNTTKYKEPVSEEVSLSLRFQWSAPLVRTSTPCHLHPTTTGLHHEHSGWVWRTTSGGSPGPPPEMDRQALRPHLPPYSSFYGSSASPEPVAVHEISIDPVFPSERWIFRNEFQNCWLGITLAYDHCLHVGIINLQYRSSWSLCIKRCNNLICASLRWRPTSTCWVYAKKVTFSKSRVCRVRKFQQKL